MPTRVQSLQFAVGSAKQADINTVSSSFVTFLKLNADIPTLVYGTENDAGEIGKGDEFVSPAGVFPTAYDHGGSLDKFGSAEFVLWSWAYALGGVALASTLYTINPLNPATSLELPLFSVAAKLAEGGGTAFNELYLGNAIEEVGLSFHYGPGRASIKNNVTYVGSGRHTIPSGVTFPTTLSEKYMISSSAAITINGVDYVSNKGILMGSIGWKNNLILPLRYYPGSGSVDSAALGGRILYGTRVPSLTFTAFLTKDSTEYAALIAQTTGTAVITFTYDATHFVTFTFHSTSFESVVRTTEEGIAAVTVVVAPKADASTGVLTVTGKCGIVDIAQ